MRVRIIGGVIGVVGTCNDAVNADGQGLPSEAVVAIDVPGTLLLMGIGLLALLWVHWKLGKDR